MRSARELGPIGRDPELGPTVTVSEGEFHDFLVGEVEVLEGVAYDVVIEASAADIDDISLDQEEHRSDRMAV